MAYSKANIKSRQILCSVSELKYQCMIYHHKKGYTHRRTVHWHARWEELKTMKKKEKTFGNTILDSWQIIFSLERAALGENSCSQTASGSWCTAGPTPGPCHNESRPPEEQEALCYDRVWTFYGIDPEVGLPWMKGRNRKGQVNKVKTKRTYSLASKLLCFAYSTSRKSLCPWRDGISPEGVFYWNMSSVPWVLKKAA